MESFRTLFQHFEALSANDAYADVVIVARAEDGSSKEFPSHLTILARSPVFERMFTGSFSEGSSRRVEIPVAKAKFVEALRHYLYTDEMDLAEEWTARDLVELMALCDKYEVPPAFQVAYNKLMECIENATTSDAKRAVEHLSCAVGQPALVREALGKIIPKLVFGSDLMQFFIWLRRFERHNSMSLAAEQKACLQKVTSDRNNLEMELASDHTDADELDITQARMLLTASFLQGVSSSLETTCVGIGTGFGYADRYGRANVRVSTTTEINTTSKPLLNFGIGLLMEDMMALFAPQTRPARESHPEEAAAKRQKLDSDSGEKGELAELHA